MAIEHIDNILCIGCGACVKACWMDVIRLDEKTGKAVIKYPEDCAVCNSCEMDCPVQAIQISQTKRHTFLLTCWGS